MDAVRGRWQVEQVLALAPKPSTIVAAQPLAVPTRWVATGCDDRAVWGRCTGTGGEPYECVVHHVQVAMRCSCPSRVHPCKHSLALLMLWARGQVAQIERVDEVPRYAAGWLAGRTPPPDAAPVDPAVGTVGPEGSTPTAAPDTPPPERDPNSTRDDRIARMAAGLTELDRWLDDRLRTGLADPSLARYRTWDDLAARLVDAQVGGLANRVRRVAGAVGAHPQWHEQVLAELGALHLLAQGGRRLGALDPSLADSVAVAIGWQVRQADVMAGVPITDDWVVMGRSDVREDRIEVRRVWLRGSATGEWAMVLSFAAYRQSLDTSFQVGTSVRADVFRYPGAVGLRVLVGRRHADAEPCRAVEAVGVSAACAEVGRALAREPWLDRHPFCVSAAPARLGDRWVLTDADGSLPLAEGTPGVAALLACSEGRAVPITAEWTPLGVVPLTVHLADRAVDVGPVADESFVGGAMSTLSSVDDYWQQMVTAALLGTDRRDAPGPPDGGLADLAADHPLPSPSQRLLQQVAACTAVCRAGLLPGPAAPLVAPPVADPRPVTPPSATATWHRIVGDWPVLEDEWVLAVVRSGRRLAPELVPPLLARHRTDAVRHARVRAAAGPLGEWMIDWSPRLACASKQRAVPELVAEVPELQLTPELAVLLHAPARDVVAAVAGGLGVGRLVTSHRAVLVNLVARVAPASLVPLAEALRRVDPALPSIGIAFALADLAHLRHHLLTELEPS